MLDKEYIAACEKWRKSVEKALAIVLSATNGLNERFMKVLEDYIEGKISLEEMEAGIERMKYLN